MIHRGEILKQIIQVDDELKTKIMILENECELISKTIEHKYQHEFKRFNEQLVIELIRKKKGKIASEADLLEIDYESFIEIGLEHGDEYYPNAYIPIWKCKGEWFQKIGYLTRRSIDQLEKIMSSLVEEMLEDKEGE